MKNTEKAAMPMSAMLWVVFAPRRLSGNRSKQPRNDPSNDSSGRTHAEKPILALLRICFLLGKEGLSHMLHFRLTAVQRARLNRIENC